MQKQNVISKCALVNVFGGRGGGAVVIPKDRPQDPPKGG